MNRKKTALILHQVLPKIKIFQNTFQDLNFCFVLGKEKGRSASSLFFSFLFHQETSTVHPRLSDHVGLNFLLGRSDTPKIRIIEDQNLPTDLARKCIVINQNTNGVLKQKGN